MKTTTTVLILIFFSMISCSKEDEIDTTSAPEITASTDEIQAIFYSSGNALPLEVNWNNDQGHYELVSNNAGVIIDSLSGLLSWSKLIGLGEHDLKIKAANTKGSETITIKLINELKGSFVGTILYPGDGTGNGRLFNI